MIFMKRLLIIISIAVIALAALFSCSSFPQLTPEDIQQIEAGMGIAFDSYVNPGSFPPRGVTASEGTTFTITWQDYTYLGITVNGSMDVTVTNDPAPATTGVSEITASFTFSGAGAPVQSIEFNIDVDFDLDAGVPANMLFIVSGLVSIDGEVFNAENLTNENVIFLIFSKFV